MRLKSIVIGYSLAHQFLLHRGDVDTSHRTIAFDRFGRHDAGALTDAEADRHDPEVGVRFVTAADTAAGKQKIVDFFRNTATGRDRVASFHMKSALRPVGIEPRTVDVVDVEVKSISGHDPVGEKPPLSDIFGGKLLQCFEVAGFADSGV